MSEHTQWEITVEELKEKMDKGESFFLLDVREAFERDIATLGGTNISIKVLPEKFKEIESHKDEEVIVYCRSGSRSHFATEFLRDEAGFKNVKNLIGGVLAWSDVIDPTMQKY